MVQLIEILIFVVAVGIFFTFTTAYKYDIFARDVDIISACDAPNVLFADDIMDLSNLTREYLTNESISVYGDVTLIRDVEQAQMHIEVYKKSRGAWVDTIFTIRRSNFCKALFDPLELWYNFTKSIGDRACPFYRGQKFNLNFIADMSLHFSDPYLAGEYKLNIKGISEHEVMCVDILIEVYRSNMGF